MSLIPFVLRQLIKKGIRNSSTDVIFQDGDELLSHLREKYPKIKAPLVIFLEGHFEDEAFEVIAPESKRWKRISSGQDFLYQSFDELYNSLNKTKTTKALEKSKESVIKELYLAITLGLLLAVINKKRKETFKTLAVQGTLSLYLQDLTKPVFDDYLGETITPSINEASKDSLYNIIELFIEKLLEKGWSKCLEDVFSLSDLDINYSSEKLIGYYFTKKEKND